MAQVTEIRLALLEQRLEALEKTAGDLKALLENHYTRKEDASKIEQTIERIDERVRELKQDVAETKKAIIEETVAKSDFQTVRSIVYGFVGLIVVAVITALIALVIRSPK